MTPAPEATRPTAWLAFRQSVVHFDTAEMNPWIGLRNAIGYALINTEADRLTNAVNTLSEEVFRLSLPSGPA